MLPIRCQLNSVVCQHLVFGQIWSNFNFLFVNRAIVLDLVFTLYFIFRKAALLPFIRCIIFRRACMSRKYCFLLYFVIRPDGLAQSLSARYRCVRSEVSRPVKSNTVSLPASHRCDVFLELCCPGPKPRRWTPPLVTDRPTLFDVIARV